MNFNNNLTFSIAPTISQNDIAFHFFIDSDTTPEQFDKWRKQYPNYNLDQSSNDATALLIATLNKNIKLIEHIVKIGGKSLLLLNGVYNANEPKVAPLDIISHFGPGYFVAKKLLQLGAPVNLVDPDFSSSSQVKTPLDHALETEEKEVAILLLRNGGTSYTYKNDTRVASFYEEVQKEIMYQNEKLFKMHYSDLSTRNVINILKEIVDYILFLSVKLELQD